MTNLGNLTFNGLYQAQVIITSQKGNTDNSTIVNVKNLTVGNATQLQAFATAVNNGTTFEGKTIYQTANINLNSVCSSTIGSWEPIGSDQLPFSGIYNGGTHTINNLYVNKNSEMDHALFGYVCGNQNNYAQIKNLTVYGTVIGTYHVAGIAGRINYATISRCYNYATITSTGKELSSHNMADYSCTGGIAGKIGIDGGNIEYSENNGTISGSYKGIGGITGVALQGSITNCKNKKDIICNTCCIGGIVGQVPLATFTSYKLLIEQCENNNNITGSYCVAGIMGNGCYTNIKKCKNSGNIESTSYMTVDGTISSSNTGGIAGAINGESGYPTTIEYCYNTGTIQSNHRGIGGIIGFKWGNFTLSMNYCYNIGSIYNNNTDNFQGKTGGIAGWKYAGTLDISNCYELEGCVKAGTDNENLNPNGHKTGEQIKAITWSGYTIKLGVNNGYPILSWEE